MGERPAHHRDWTSSAEPGLDEESSQLYDEWSTAVDRRLRVRLMTAAREMPIPPGRRRFIPWTRSPVVVAALVAMLLMGTALAVSSLPSLGRPTTDVPEAYAHLVGFHPGGPVLRQGGKAKVFLFDALWDIGTAMDRWFVVKALAQFGTWSGLDRGQTTEKDYSIFAIKDGMVLRSPPASEIDLAHAHYTSRYVMFVHRVVQSRSNGPLSHLSPGERTVFQRFLHVKPAWSSLDPPMNTRQPDPFPVIAIGGYGMHGPFDNPLEIMLMTDPTTGRSAPASFESMEQALQKGDDAPSIGYVVREINTYANVVTALVCHTDGGRPAGVCGRPWIKRILKQLG